VLDRRSREQRRENEPKFVENGEHGRPDLALVYERDDRVFHVRMTIAFRVPMYGWTQR